MLFFRHLVIIAIFHDLFIACLRSLLILSLVAFGVHSDSVICQPRSENSAIWLRNRCQNRFVVPGKKCVWARGQGMNMTDDRIKIIREACQDPMEPELVLTRLYSVYRQRYICFNGCGHLRSTKNPIQRGKLCTFIEHYRQPNEVMYQSYQNPNFVLGFSKSHRRVSFPTKFIDFMKKVHDPFEDQFCQFRFIAGSVKVDKSPWNGLQVLD